MPMPPPKKMAHESYQMGSVKLLMEISLVKVAMDKVAAMHKIAVMAQMAMVAQMLLGHKLVMGVAWAMAHLLVMNCILIQDCWIDLVLFKCHNLVSVIQYA